MCSCRWWVFKIGAVVESEKETDLIYECIRGQFYCKHHYTETQWWKSHYLRESINSMKKHISLVHECSHAHPGTTSNQINMY